MRKLGLMRLMTTFSAVGPGTLLAGERGQTNGQEAPGPETLRPAMVAGNSPAAATASPSLSFSSRPYDEATFLRRTEAATVEESAAPTFSFSLEYSLYSDYIFRGINFSEFPGEGREKLNHQLGVDLDIDLGLLFHRDAGTLGTLSVNTWFEWFAAQKQIDPINGGQNLQEVDYSIEWSYYLDPIATTLTLGYTFFTFPNAKDINTSEWSIRLDHNDARMWKSLWPDNKHGVLNPSFLFVQDVGVTDGGAWIELGVRHDFALCKNFRLAPSIVLAIDHRYLDPLVGTGRGGTTRFAYVQYGLKANYDLTPLLKLPERAGAVTVSGFLYFNDALGSAKDDLTIQDEFFGGMSIGWSFGG